MKLFYTTIFFFSLGLCYAQHQNLFDYEWKLEQIITDDQTFEPVPYPNPNASTALIEQIYFSEYEGIYEFIFGYYGNALGVDLIFDDVNSSFEMTNFYNHLGGTSPGESFFKAQFIYTDNTQFIWHEPFVYDFRFENNLIYLDITNNVGSVATFFDSTLSHNNFEKQKVSIYPNPATDVIYVKHQNLNIYQIQIYNLAGKLVKETNQVSQLKHNSFDISNLISGVYIMKIKTDKSTLQKKLIKK